MSALELLATLVFSGLASASLAICVRAVIADLFGRVDLVLETRPLSCNTCMAFWGCMVVALCIRLFTLPAHGPSAYMLAALGGVVVAVKLLEPRGAP